MRFMDHSNSKTPAFKAGTLKAVKAFMLGAVLITLSACAAITAASGPYKVGRGFTVELPAVWSDITGTSMRLPYVRTLTMEGPGLDLLVLTDGIAPGQALTRRVTRSDERRGNTQIPVVRAAMNELELVEFVVDSIAADDFQDVEPLDVTPVSVAGTDGVSFEYTAKTTKGLNIRGQARAMQVADGRVYVMLFLAPEEHYYARISPMVTRIFESARF